MQKKKKAAAEASQAPLETAASNSEAVPKADKRANDKRCMEGSHLAVPLRFNNSDHSAQPCTSLDRFSSAIAALAGDEEDSMWVALQACSIFESKMKRVRLASPLACLNKRVHKSIP